MGRQRQPVCIAIVGTTGTGKSTFAHNHVYDLLAKHNNRGLVVTYADDPEIWQPYKEVDINQPIQHSGIKKMTLSKAESIAKNPFWNLYKMFRNGVLILDDCRQYIPSNIRHMKGLNDMVVNHRHLGLDIIFVVHEPEDIPPKVRPMIKRAYISRCTTIINKSNFRVADPHLFIAAQREAIKLCKKRRQKWGVFVQADF